MAGICRNRLKGKHTGSNYHIFLNSVEGIYWIIRNAGLTPENTRVVCSQSSGKQNTAKLHGFPISRTADQTRTNFEDIYRRYSEIRHEKPIMFTTDWEIELSEAIYPFIGDAYTKLGDEKVKSLKYRVGAIQDALTAMSRVDTDLKIVEMADRRFPKQTPIPVKKIKEELQKIYDTVGVNRRAKATDMGQWYDTVTSPKRIDGKNVSCMTIIRSRFVRSDF